MRNMRARMRKRVGVWSLLPFSVMLIKNREGLISGRRVESDCKNVGITCSASRRLRAKNIEDVELIIGA